MLCQRPVAGIGARLPDAEAVGGCGAGHREQVALGGEGGAGCPLQGPRGTVPGFRHGGGDLPVGSLAAHRGEKAADRHVTADSLARAAAGLGVAWTDHEVPSRASARVRCAPVPDW